MGLTSARRPRRSGCTLRSSRTLRPRGSVRAVRAVRACWTRRPGRTCRALWSGQPLDARHALCPRKTLWPRYTLLPLRPGEPLRTLQSRHARCSRRASGPLLSSGTLEAGRPTGPTHALQAGRSDVTPRPGGSARAGISLRAICAGCADESLRAARTRRAQRSGNASWSRRACGTGRSHLAAEASWARNCIPLRTWACRERVRLDEGNAPRSTVRIGTSCAGERDAADRGDDARDEECAQIVRAIEFRRGHREPSRCGIPSGTAVQERLCSQ